MVEANQDRLTLGERQCSCLVFAVRDWQEFPAGEVLR
jgi:hypothetical protein